MTMVGKLVSIQEMRSDAATFYNLFTQSFHQISETTHLVDSCRVHEGPPATLGSILHWAFIHDNRAKEAKQVIEGIDAERHSITLKLIEGDMLDEYTIFIVTMLAKDKEDGIGSRVTWTIDFEKLNLTHPAPTSYLDIIIRITDSIDWYIQEVLPNA